MDIHVIIFQNTFEYLQSPWYAVSKTSPDFSLVRIFPGQILYLKNIISDFLQSDHGKIFKVKFYLNSKSGGVSETQYHGLCEFKKVFSKISNAYPLMGINYGLKSIS